MKLGWLTRSANETTSPGRFPRHAWSLLIYVGVVSLATVWGRAAYEAYLRNRRLLAECGRISADIDRLSAENIALRREQKALMQDPFAIESVLRQDRGLMAAGEIRLDPPPAPRPAIYRADTRSWAKYSIKAK